MANSRCRIGDVGGWVGETPRVDDRGHTGCSPGPGGATRAGGFRCLSPIPGFTAWAWAINPWARELTRTADDTALLSLSLLSLLLLCEQEAMQPKKNFIFLQQAPDGADGNNFFGGRPSRGGRGGRPGGRPSPGRGFGRGVPPGPPLPPHMLEQVSRAGRLLPVLPRRVVG